MNRLVFWLGVLGISLLANSVVQGEGPRDRTVKGADESERISAVRVSHGLKKTIEVIQTIFN